MTDIGYSRRRWRRAFFALLIAFVLAVGALLYATTGRGTGYAEQRPHEQGEELDVAMRFIAGQQPPLTRSTVLRVLRRQNPKAKILATDSTVSIGELVFRFDQSGRLDEVTRVAP